MNSKPLDKTSAATSTATGAALSARRPASDDVTAWTDTYFNRTREIVGNFGSKSATYAVFMRRPVTSAPRLAADWIRSVAATRGIEVDVEVVHEEGKWVGAGEPLLYITGPLDGIADMETLWLQKLGPACVAAYNAYTMCVELPKVAFMAFDARHCAGTEMAELMAYGCSVGSAKAQRKVGAVGFVGCAVSATAHFFGSDKGLGTMPHALIGYAGSTVRAAEMYHETYPDEDLTVLIDYFGREVTDSLEVCRRFPELAAAGKLAVRIDTPGSRFMEELDPADSYAALERNAPDAIRGYRSDVELRYLIGTGVSAAAVWLMRERLDEAGFEKVKIVASSGFGPAKCRVFSLAEAPVDAIGTGSYLPDDWHETYATADIIEYDGEEMVKLGREFLFRKGND